MIDLMNPDEVKKFVDGLLERSQYNNFGLTIEERKAMIEILKEHPDAIQTKPKIAHKPSARRPSLDDYNYSRRRAMAYTEQ